MVGGGGDGASVWGGIVHLQLDLQYKYHRVIYAILEVDISYHLKVGHSVFTVVLA